MTGFRPDYAMRKRGRLVLVVVLLGIILALSVVAAIRYLRVDEIQLPDLRGMQFGEAVSLLRDRSLVPVSYPENVPGAAIEAVTSQTPPPGAIVRQGRTVAIGVHRPPEASRAPVLVGLTADQAINTVTAVNLTLDNVDYAHSSQPAGRVIGQRPEPGERVDADAGLAIVVSRGPEQAQVTLPDLVGMPLERARQRLQELGIRRVESLAGGVSFDSPGTVSAQQPGAGEEVSSASPVVLSYNLSARQVVPVPSLVGQSADMASRLLRAAGLTVGELRYVDEAEVPRGSVVEVNPSGFTLRGTPIALTVFAESGSLDELRSENDEDRFGPAREEAGDVGGGPAEDARTDGDSGAGRRVTVTFDPALLGVRSLIERDYDLRLVVQDDEGERTVVDRRVRAGETVSAVVVVQGDAILQTYINGVFFQAWRP
ncbi:MAG: PASTA domain-containing protein [Trueperaceae bacterium]